MPETTRQPDADRSEFNAARRTILKAAAGAAVLSASSILTMSNAEAQTVATDADNFYKSGRSSFERVAFKTAYNTSVVANLHIPDGLDRSAKHSAIIVSHPMGAVKEQSANLYAAKMADQGFVTVAIDLPFWGESDGQPRQAVSPDFYAEAYSAAADYLGTLAYVDINRIGVIGICGSGAFALSAAKIDPRLKAIATVSMYDHGTLYRKGLGGTQTPEQFRQFLNEAAEQRVKEANGGAVRYAAGAPTELTGNAIGDEFYDFYRTPRGEVTPVGASPKTSSMPTMVTNIKFANFYPLEDLNTVSRPLLFISGDQAHSKEFSELAYSKAAEPRELYWVKGAGHVDLYDRVNLIPFDKLTAFFSKNLNQAGN
ncbi:Hydrolase of the alpha/beta family protein [Neorhizobium galegae bv. officinalis]|uniref:Hydrolase of the alpha/beta family protein n=1 Tax=Neorhizobium galegae bv. officinalis TaxID=323656 RepID=A0A0T7FA18_NEOGA|nr:alpha/beta hydrolase [Neorhizobium galegae]CDZ31887.1 Hydrolase of the alpha/beta family protein [Neorhizobium galegae bv. officinalis]